MMLPLRMFFNMQHIGFIMTFSVPQNALIVIADGAHISYFRNVANSGIKLEKVEMPASETEHQGARSLPTETSPREKSEATFANNLAEDLYRHVHKGGIDAIILVADPQTLGQIRPSLHPEVKSRICGELHKTLTKSSVSEIQDILANALTKAA